MTKNSITLSSIELPEPSLDHLKRLTDDTGLFQHALFTIPDRTNGYTTDDNARAAMAMTKYYAKYPEPEALRLLGIYLSFILHSQNSDGSIRNFMNFNRTWREDEPASDALGRVLWACGTIIAQPPSPSYLSIVKDCFDKSVEQVQKQYPRSIAYSILGMADYLKQFSRASDIKRQLEIAADGLVNRYKENNYPDWRWFEDVLAYDNAVLPHSLFVAGLTLESKKYREIAEKTCEFLLENTFNGKHFSFIGCHGWYKRGRTRAAFDQQPLEAAGTVMMLRAAYDATENDYFLTLQRKAFNWFFGENDLHMPLYDSRTKGCCDALTPDGVNDNQGAESMLSFLLGLLAIVESYTIVDKVEGGKAHFPPQTNLVEQIIEEKPAPIKKSIR